MEKLFRGHASGVLIGLENRDGVRDGPVWVRLLLPPLCCGKGITTCMTKPLFASVVEW